MSGPQHACEQQQQHHHHNHSGCVQLVLCQGLATRTSIIAASAACLSQHALVPCTKDLSTTPKHPLSPHCCCHSPAPSCSAAAPPPTQRPCQSAWHNACSSCWSSRQHSNNSSSSSQTPSNSSHHHQKQQAHHQVGSLPHWLLNVSVPHTALEGLACRCQHHNLARINSCMCDCSMLS